jgi:dienelactone hydrolase
MNAASSSRRKGLALVAVAALTAAFPPPAQAEQRVTFATAASSDIAGYLTKPRGTGPFAAVALLHSCLGLPVDRRAIGETIAGWGYVALFVDDFLSRGL